MVDNDKIWLMLNYSANVNITIVQVLTSPVTYVRNILWSLLPRVMDRTSTIETSIMRAARIPYGTDTKR